MHLSFPRGNARSTTLDLNIATHTITLVLPFHLPHLLPRPTVTTTTVMFISLAIVVGFRCIRGQTKQWSHGHCRYSGTILVHCIAFRTRIVVDKCLVRVQEAHPPTDNRNHGVVKVSAIHYLF